MGFFQALLPQAFKWVFTAQIQMSSFSLTLLPQSNLETISPITAGDEKNFRQKMTQSHLTLVSRATFLCNGLRKKEDIAWLGKFV